MSSCLPWRACAWLGVLGVASACSTTPATQIVLRIDVDESVEVPCDFHYLTVEVPGVAQREIDPVLGKGILNDRTQFPAQLTLIDGPKGQFTVAVVGTQYPSESVRQFVQPVVLPGFVSGKSLVANIKIDPSCGLECEPIELAAADLKPYTARGKTHPLTACAIYEICDDDDNDLNGMVDDAPECRDASVVIPCDEGMCTEAAPTCHQGLCRTVETSRYQGADGITRVPDACDTGNAKTVLAVGSDASHVDASFYVAIDDGEGGERDLPFYFYGRKVYGFWIGVDGWIAVDFTEGAETEPPAVGLGGDSDANVKLDSPDAPPGVYPFWHNLRLRTMDGELCVNRTFKNDTELSKVVVTWSLACFEDGCESNDKLRFGVEFSAADSGSDSLAKVAGNITVGFEPNHLSSSFPDLALHGRTADGTRSVTIGVKDAVAPRCAPYDGSVDPDDANAVADVCDPFSGVCPEDGAPCGFSQIPDPFLQGAQGQQLMNPVYIDTTMTPPRTSQAASFALSAAE